jgi:phospholipid transport system substrate-binding protein
MIKKIFLLTLFLTTLCFGLTKENIKVEMTKNIDKVLDVLKNSKLSKDEKGNKIKVLMDSYFDYSLMSRLSLGKKWKELSAEEKKEFSQLFVNKLKESYIDKLQLYTDQAVEVLKTEEPKKNRIVLKTQVIGKDKNYDINYKFYKTKDNDSWLIYDVDLIGVSIIQTYRKQFAGFLRDKSFKELLSHLKTKN